MKNNTNCQYHERHSAPIVLICPSGFKESLDPSTAADCIETGVLRAYSDAVIHKIPLVDGGEGFAEALIKLTNGELRHLSVTGPIRAAVDSHIGLLGNEHTGTAVVEMAAAAGLRLVPSDQRHPLYTTTYGVGQLIRAALDAGARKILVGCGDSGTCDGGVGMAQALGARFFNHDGGEIPISLGAASLSNLAIVDTSTLHPQLESCQLDVACNWHNVLCGKEGVARIFGPQKGASSAEVEAMSQAMSNCARVFGSHLGREIGYLPGSGASGGLGAGLMLIGARLHPRYDIIMRFLNLDALLAKSDLVFTAEGAIDYQTPRGKIPAEVARRAKLRGLPVIALVGTVGAGADGNYDAGIDAFVSMLQRPMSLQEAINEAEELLEDSAEAIMRMILIGKQLFHRELHKISMTAYDIEQRASINIKDDLVISESYISTQV